MAEPEFRQVYSEPLRELRGSQLLAEPDINAAFSAIPRHLFLPQFDLTMLYAIPGGSLVDRLSLHLIPIDLGKLHIETVRLCKREDHYLHVWLD